LKIKCIIIFALYTCLLAPVFSDDSMQLVSLQPQNETELITNLLAWLDKQYIFPDTNVVHPQIQFADAHTLCHTSLGDNYTMHQISCKDIAGLYNNESKTIYINQSIDITTMTGKAVVLHELVHHLQFEFGYTNNMKNIQELEGLSYYLEKRYLSSNIDVALN